MSAQDETTEVARIHPEPPPSADPRVASTRGAPGVNAVAIGGSWATSLPIHRQRPGQPPAVPTGDGVDAQPPQALNPDDRQTTGIWLSPPMDPDWLATRLQFSSILPQCVAALASNIEGYGHTFVPTYDPSEVDDATLAAALLEQDRAERFFRFCCSEMSFRELTRRSRIDQSTVGWSAWELLRARKPEEAGMAPPLRGFEHLPARNMRLVPQGDDYVPVVRRVLDLDGSEWHEQVVWRRLRLYVQLGNGTAVRRYFKEPGDPRRVLSASGTIERSDDGLPLLMEPDDYADPKYAHELLWFGEYDPSGPYPLPPWIGAAISLSGARSAEAVNWLYFDNKALPPFVVLVSGGVVSPESMTRLEEQLNQTRGIENFYKGLVLEALPVAGATDITGTGSQTTPRIEIKPLIDMQHGDALFMQYDAASRLKVRSACGVPSVFVGESEDYSFATARVSMLVAEQSTFGPKRDLVAEQIQMFVMSELGILWNRFGFKGPKLTDAREVAEIVKTATESGIGTANELAPVIADALNTDISATDAPWGSIPLAVMQMAAQTGGAVITLDDTTQVDGFASPEAAINELRSVLERAVNAARVGK